jgi:hypothetical protein
MAQDEDQPIHILWINAGLGCDGDFGGTRIVDVLVGDPLPRIC